MVASSWRMDSWGFIVLFSLLLCILDSLHDKNKMHFVIKLNIQLNLFFFNTKTFCVGVELINNVVVVSGGQLRVSAICIHVSILPQTTLPPSKLKKKKKVWVGWGNAAFIISKGNDSLKVNCNSTSRIQVSPQPPTSLHPVTCQGLWAFVTSVLQLRENS